MQPLKEVNRDADKLDQERVKLGTKVQQIILEQEAVVTASEKGIKMINSDLKAMRRRLAPFMGKKPRKPNTSISWGGFTHSSMRPSAYFRFW